MRAPWFSGISTNICTKLPTDLGTNTSTMEHMGRYIYIWGFPGMGVPQNGWFIRKNPTKMDDLGDPLFQETTIYININYQPLSLGWPSTVIHCPKSISSYLCPYKDYKHTINTTYITFTSGQPDVNNDP